MLSQPFCRNHAPQPQEHAGIAETCSALGPRGTGYNIFAQNTFDFNFSDAASRFTSLHLALFLLPPKHTTPVRPHMSLTSTLHPTPQAQSVVAPPGLQASCIQRSKAGEAKCKRTSVLPCPLCKKQNHGEALYLHLYSSGHRVRLRLALAALQVHSGSSLRNHSLTCSALVHLMYRIAGVLWVMNSRGTRIARVLRLSLS